MRIYESIQSHFAAYVDKPLHTLARKRQFRIRQGFEEGTSSRVLNLEIGPNKTLRPVYLTDLLHAYNRLLRAEMQEWISLDEIRKVLTISPAQDTYIMALLATFDDIEARPDGSAIRFMPP